jgi:hypothetical protein
MLWCESFFLCLLTCQQFRDTNRGQGHNADRDAPNQSLVMLYQQAHHPQWECRHNARDNYRLFCWLLE